ncbi:tyrosine-type recombinase/integrase [Mucisphaera sp.]|uniref:tyrosine-type recombinase/integrase n=1 Tax=Mucisphaera sp. TaxID=2913024 RepID=UPI003D13403A
MASLSQIGKPDARGRRAWRLDVTYAKNKRRGVRLGRMRKEAAETIRRHVCNLEDDKKAGRRHTAETEAWLNTIDADLLAWLSESGLVAEAGKRRLAVGDLTDKAREYQKRNEPSSQANHRQAMANLDTYFGRDRLIQIITPEDAEAFRSWLATNARRQSGNIPTMEQTKASRDKQAGSLGGLSKATVNRRMTHAKACFRLAQQWGLIDRSPFEYVKGGAQENPERQVYISEAETEQLIGAAQDAYERGLIALARYGGLRTPSEPRAIRIMDVKLDQGFILVHDQKRKKDAKTHTRRVPIYPQLRPYIEDLLEIAPEGAVMLLPEQSFRNFQKRMAETIQRAGLTPWPRVWHNLRASRATELTQEGHAMADAARWMGHTIKTMASHYVMSCDETEAIRKAAQINVNEAPKKRSANRSAASTQRGVHEGNQQACTPPEEPESKKSPPCRGADGRHWTRTSSCKSWFRHTLNIASV